MTSLDKNDSGSLDGAGTVSARTIERSFPSGEKEQYELIEHIDAEDIAVNPTFTYQLDDEYDVLFIEFVEWEITDNTFVGIQVNGDTGSNYTFRDRGGSQTSGEPQWDVGTGYNTGFDGIVEITGVWGESCRMGNRLRGGRKSESGFNKNVTSPLTQFTVVQGGGNALEFNGDINVYGKKRP